jgi:NADH-quinone oxidoreductase subunit K
MGLQAYLTLAAVVFCIGIFGVITRRNTIGILLGIELMLNSVNINLVAFSRFSGDITGMVFTVFTICITVTEAALGLAIVILLFRVRRTVTADHLDLPGDDQRRCFLAAIPGSASSCWQCSWLRRPGARGHFRSLRGRLRRRRLAKAQRGVSRSGNGCYAGQTWPRWASWPRRPTIMLTGGAWRCSQVYSLGYPARNRRKGSGATTPTSRCSRSR